MDTPDPTDTHSQNKQVSQVPVVLLHNSVGTRNEDIYILDIALGLYKNDYNVSIVTSQHDQAFVFKEFPIMEDRINILSSCWWIPNSIVGMFKYCMSCLKSVCMAIGMLTFPPHPRPQTIILDIETIALPLLWLGKYRTVYVKHFSDLQKNQYIQKSKRISLDVLTSLTISYADTILVQSKQLKDLFREAYPKLTRQIQVLHPCYDTEIWPKSSVNLKLLLPDLLIVKPCIFLAIGKYKEESNFQLLLEGIQQLFETFNDPFKNSLCFIIAGNYKQIEDTPYYHELLYTAATRSYASQISFVTYLTPPHMKSLVELCTVLVHLKTDNIYPSASILSAMSMWKPIIAMNSGFSNDVLSDKISALLIEPTASQLANAMKTIAIDAQLQHTLGSNAHNEFTSKFTYKRFRQTLREIVGDISYLKH